MYDRGIIVCVFSWMYTACSVSATMYCVCSFRALSLHSIYMFSTMCMLCLCLCFRLFMDFERCVCARCSMHVRYVFVCTCVYSLDSVDSSITWIRTCVSSLLTCCCLAWLLLVSLVALSNCIDTFIYICAIVAVVFMLRFAFALELIFLILFALMCSNSSEHFEIIYRVEMMFLFNLFIVLHQSLHQLNICNFLEVRTFCSDLFSWASLAAVNPMKPINFR